MMETELETRCTASRFKMMDAFLYSTIEEGSNRESRISRYRSLHGGIAAPVQWVSS